LVKMPVTEKINEDNQDDEYNEDDPYGGNQSHIGIRTAETLPPVIPIKISSKKIDTVSYVSAAKDKIINGNVRNTEETIVPQPVIIQIKSCD